MMPHRVTAWCGALGSPQMLPVEQAPQSSVPPQPSGMVPQLAFCAEQVVGTQAGFVAVTTAESVAVASAALVATTWNVPGEAGAV